MNVQKNIAGVAQGGCMMTYRTCRHETTWMNLLSYFSIAVSAIQNHNCVAVIDFE